MGLPAVNPGSSKDVSFSHAVRTTLLLTKIAEPTHKVSS
ncbi:MAG: hypothetical protein BWY67_02266 [Bacteroidetes bacterium ADurb.Bin397]|nr:MAG: hypothetical protein BWY67_02266 [Bacteroidetes bacterium ADurb.Bin397]